VKICEIAWNPFVVPSVPTAYAVAISAASAGKAPNVACMYAVRFVWPNSKTRPSWPFDPVRTGTLATLPAARAAFGLLMSVTPSRTGWNIKP